MSLALMDVYNPTVQTLLRDNKKLRADNERLKTTLCKYQHIASPEDRKVTRLITEIEKLKAELAEAKKDAERYRWLRDNKFRHNGHCLALTGQILWETDLDNACDQAMKGK